MRINKQNMRVEIEDPEREEREIWKVIERGGEMVYINNCTIERLMNFLIDINQELLKKLKDFY